eukprot:331243-Chlamydomonas_euryale.AAC.1
MTACVCVAWPSTYGRVRELIQLLQDLPHSTFPLYQPRDVKISTAGFTFSAVEPFGVSKPRAKADSGGVETDEEGAELLLRDVPCRASRWTVGAGADRHSAPASQGNRRP